MRCPFCSYPDSRVLDSRPADDGRSIRRRRECGGCGRRFTTYERVDELPLMVVKKDGRREVFDRHKLLTGLTRACQKRPVPMAGLEAMVDEIEQELRNRGEMEVATRDIGEMVMGRLRRLDEVAYVRFASVYREFRDVDGFLREIQSLSDCRREENK
ncbi:transcriptional regulator NrdR [Desulfotomaculum copahuensis]|uniref:Transcriptional repressor NrdR n=1 Tax=Desulfotomaculum copahuensis TaxID=1838280 RepID=A0A1B7LEU3_9FIRM|nr:transcriptional regulator NrdR [Desulfotomaculum copahuensis]OAT81792.1 transcriptional regulator NrdR [Desulfotomaculum copahuensis]